MGDPHLEAVARFTEAVDRLNSQLEKERSLVERVAKLETLGRSIDDLRRDFREFSDRAVTKEHLASAIQLAISEYRNEDLERGQRAQTMGSGTKFRLEDLKSRRYLWVKILGMFIALAVAALTVYSSITVARIQADREVRGAK